ncbi:hypothetical protein ACG3SL_04220 [Sphingomonas sp. CJ20]
MHFEAAGAFAPAPQDGRDTLETLRTALEAMASGLDARFVTAGSALSQTYAVVEKLVAALERVTNAMDGEGTAVAIANMRGTADRLLHLPTLQAARAEALHAVQAIGPALRREIDRVHRTLSFLRICGLNIKVAAAGMGEFGDFADGMFAKLDVAEAEMAGIAVEIERLATTVPDVFGVEERLAAECAAVVPHVPESLAGDALALQHYQMALAERAGQVATVARAVRTTVATALGALQIGDITRQRIEHVVEGLGTVAAFAEAHPEIDPAHAEAIRGHAIALLAAQAADTARDFQREAGLLMQSLHGIAPRAAELLEFRQGGDAGGTESEAAFLAGLEKSVAEAENVTGRLREADAHAQRLGSATSTTAEHLGARLRNVHRVKNDVQHMAWNTDLRCYRMGDAGRGLAVIASEIRGFAVMLEEISDRIGTLFEQLTAAAGAIRGQEDAEVTQSLADSLECIRAGGQRMREGMAGLGDDASVIADMLRNTTEAVDCDAVGRAMADHAELLAGFGAAQDVIPEAAQPAMAALFDTILRSYTMAREREVHRDYVPGTDMGVAEVADDDDDDDGLF